MDGILPVDKPRGASSHDLVGWARRALGTRAVGHAGTLDPMATGLLVLLVGEATKLSAYVMEGRKRYDATVAFGSATDSLDADGAVVATMPEGTPPPEEPAVRDAVAAMVGPMMQVPPAVSALKVGGVPAYKRARDGEALALDARAVELDRAEVTTVRAEPPGCDVSIACSKGFYVRSFARDLAGRLGTLGHLTALRRTRSGVIDLADALDGEVLRAASRGDGSAKGAVLAALRPLSYAASLMATSRVDDARADDLWHGRAVPDEGDDAVLLVLREDGSPLCVAERSAGVLKVRRGLRPVG